ncbi:GAK system CofD-like protein [Salidesulfovibrio brasiliensis]|uniref:GAK system CofD-like protein n=1 Tax=Salidesulfovibrio brasiliensis TaxID=221711 RepID=UPI0006D0159A|nr:GAK system CofD-like protein [Salidesulfovibrio brasiliensis]
MRISITREAAIPDRLKIERYRRAPELGPRILFFSGGTALRGVSRALIRYTHNSIHFITPFDSGGSSAVLRKAFGMLAVGDIRNRLMSLADQSVKGNPEIFDLFVHRLSKKATQDELCEELQSMASGKHELVRRIPDPMRKIIRNNFHQFLESMPGDFDLKGASVGNIVLTAGYLSNRRQMDPVIFIFSKLVQVCGVVRPIVNKNMHLAARLQDGSVIVGQHRMTGKEVAPLASPIEEVWLTDTLDDETPKQAYIRSKVRDRIAEADLICYPIGSFYSSVVANLLPQGVGKAVAENTCPKVFVPNTGYDPEAFGLGVADQVEQLKRYLQKSGAPEGADVLGYVIVDTEHGEYPGGIDIDAIERLGVKVVDSTLVTEESAPYIDGDTLAAVLLSLT